MDRVIILFPAPLYNAAKEVCRIRAEQNGDIDNNPLEADELIKRIIENAVYNYLDDELREYWLDTLRPEHILYEKAFEYMREYLEWYFQRIEEIKNDVYKRNKNEKEKEE